MLCYHIVVRLASCLPNLWKEYCWVFRLHYTIQPEQEADGENAMSVRLDRIQEPFFVYFCLENFQNTDLLSSHNQFACWHRNPLSRNYDRVVVRCIFFWKCYIVLLFSPNFIAAFVTPYLKENLITLFLYFNFCVILFPIGSTSWYLVFVVKNIISYWYFLFYTLVWHIYCKLI